MINTNGNETKHNPKWRCISDHPCRILMIGSSGSRKTNALLKESIITFQKTVNLLPMQ